MGGGGVHGSPDIVWFIIHKNGEKNTRDNGHTAPNQKFIIVATLRMVGNR